MTTAFKRSMIVAAILICGAMSASADTYTFDDGGDGHDWNTAYNWNPDVGGPPGANDTAIIPNTFTCEIGDANQAVATLQIDTGGVLQIKGKDLTVHDAVTVNGDLEFHKPGNDDPRLLIHAWTLTIDGAGTISASAADELGPGIIEGAATYHPSMTFDVARMKGSLKIRTPFRNNTEFLVDHDDDVMEIGYMNSTTSIYIFPDDTGGYKVTNGQMKFGNTIPTGFKSGWELEGGELTLTKYAAHDNWLLTKHDIDISAGTLEIESGFFGATGPFRFRGGDIKVAAGSFAVFFKLPQ